MVETVVSFKLPVGEHLIIQKNRLQPEEGMPNIGRISIVTGLHGDELEGQYVCYKLNERVKANPEYLNGIIDIYPALNPLGIDTASRMDPKLHMDMNRIFPGTEHGTMMDKVAARILTDIAGSDICIDVHSSDTFVRELPQVRLSEEYAQNLADYARLLNADLIWINTIATEYEATLANSLNAISVPTLMIEMGLGNRINMDIGDQIVDGIFNLMHKIGIWTGPVDAVKVPSVSRLRDIDFYRAQKSGIFLTRAVHGVNIKAGELIGKIVSPLTGEIKEEVVAKQEGLLFTLREHPLVYEGGLLARVLRKP